MSFPFPIQQTGSANPIENTITSINSNPYFIGSMMLLLNLGGRHLATGLTPEQDKFFQQPWFRQLLIFVIFFIGTRNIISSFFMSIVFILLIGYLFNDTSTLYIFNPSIDSKKSSEKTAPVNNVLTPEEQDIHKKLSEKLQKANAKETITTPIKKDITSQISETYSTIMSRF